MLLFLLWPFILKVSLLLPEAFLALCPGMTSLISKKLLAMPDFYHLLPCLRLIF